MDLLPQNGPPQSSGRGAAAVQASRSLGSGPGKGQGQLALLCAAQDLGGPPGDRLECPWHTRRGAPRPTPPPPAPREQAGAGPRRSGKQGCGVCRETCNSINDDEKLVSRS